MFLPNFFFTRNKHGRRAKTWYALCSYNASNFAVRAFRQLLILCKPVRSLLLHASASGLLLAWQVWTTRY
jgi:hypothetical protein